MHEIQCYQLDLEIFLSRLSNRFFNGAAIVQHPLYFPSVFFFQINITDGIFRL